MLDWGLAFSEAVADFVSDEQPHMIAHYLPGILVGAILVAFIVFAFRQGLKVKPDHREDTGPSVGFGGDSGSS